MSPSLAFSAPASVPSDYVGAPMASMLLTDVEVAGATAQETDPAAGINAVGAALQTLSLPDATAILEALSEQATALSLVLAADAAGAITLPESLRAVVRAAAVLPPFLGGAN